MSVGIFDADIAKYRLVPFNLEAMKLSAYYKKKGEIVVLSPSFTPQRNTKFFYRKDYNDGDFPSDLTSYKNVEYGGLAFSNNVYAPLPREIELMAPDTLLYERVETFMKAAEGGSTLEKNKIFKNLISGEHCRLSLDGHTIWPDYGRQFKCLSSARNLLIHDYDLGAVDGGYETVVSILKRARTDGWATKVGMKFPVQVSDGDSLLKWSSLNSNSTFYSLRYTGVMNNDAFNEWVGKIRQRAVYSQIEYVITAPQYSEEELISYLPQIFKQVVISRSYRIFYSLIYDEDFFHDKRWCDVIRLINYYHNSYSNEIHAKYWAKISQDTMFDFAKNTHSTPYAYYGDVLNRNEIRKLFVFVRERNYELFQLFYECTAKSLGGRL